MTELRSRMIETMTLAGLSPKTQKAYLDSVIGMVRFTKLCPTVTSDDQIRQYLLYCRNVRKNAHKTIYLKYHAIRYLWVEVLKKPFGLEGEVPAADRKRLPIVLTEGEVASILDHVRSPKIRLALKLAYCTGLRTMELISLKRGQIDLERMMLYVICGKGRKDRHVPLPSLIKTELKKHIANLNTDDYIFGAFSGNHRYMSPTVLYKTIKEASFSAGIKKPVSAHTLRHSYATRLYERGVDLQVIQHLLGHASITTTLIYAHLTSITQERLALALEAITL